MGKEDEVSLNRLIQIHQQVKDPGPLIKLQTEFYDQVRLFVDKLKESYDREHAKDSSSMKTLQLADQLKKARDLRLAILRERTRKLLLLAHQSSAGSSVDTKNLTPEEKDLFDSVIAALTTGRRRILEGGLAAPVTAGSGEPAEASAATEPAEPVKTGAAVENAPEPEPQPARVEHRPAAAATSAAAPELTDSDDLVVVRIVEDVPGFAVGGGECTLGKKDVVALPKNLASALQTHGKAKPVG